MTESGGGGNLRRERSGEKEDREPQWMVKREGAKGFSKEKGWSKKNQKLEKKGRIR